MKKSNLNIKRVVICFFLLVILSVGTIFGYHAFFNNQNPTPIEDTKKEDPKTNAPKPNAFSHLPYYQEELLSRYQGYQTSTNNLSTEDIVTHVNMNLDLGFYQEDPTWINNADALDVLVNKFYKLPDSFEPINLILVNLDREQYLRQEAAEAFFALRDACEAEGFSLSAFSGYRSISKQESNYNNMIASFGEEHTNRYVARPGQSEHNTGLAVDVSIDGIYYEDIESSPYYPWFREQLVNYGFILRYPEGKEDITGFGYESWHLRYLGEDLARKVVDSGLTYDEYVARQ
ncbi:MAG: M15 family metallopeptidase [Coprobacillaceae bacterium]